MDLHSKALLEFHMTNPYFWSKMQNNFETSLEISRSMYKYLEIMVYTHVNFIGHACFGNMVNEILLVA